MLLLDKELYEMRHHFAAAAQLVYDEWEQGPDDELNGGGICHLIAEAICDVLCLVQGRVLEWGTISNDGVGEQHVWVIVHDYHRACTIDVPYWRYEAGSGYSWTKIPGVTFTPDDIDIAGMSLTVAQTALQEYR